jgi:hypothetical protein
VVDLGTNGHFTNVPMGKIFEDPLKLSNTFKCVMIVLVLLH